MKLRPEKYLLKPELTSPLMARDTSVLQSAQNPSLPNMCLTKSNPGVNKLTMLPRVSLNLPMLHIYMASLTSGLTLSEQFRTSTSCFYPLENAIQSTLIPAITGRPPCSQQERDLLALPIRFGGLGLTNPVSQAAVSYDESVKLTAPLVQAISQVQPFDKSLVKQIKSSIHKSNRNHQKLLADTVYCDLPPSMQRLVDLAKQKGSSSWVSVLPLKDHGFSLHKGDFRDASVYDMAGNHLTLPLNATVAALFL